MAFDLDVTSREKPHIFSVSKLCKYPEGIKQEPLLNNLDLLDLSIFPLALASGVSLWFCFFLGPRKNKETTSN